jgi:transcriptional regulator with XRE-family HTH domain
MVARRLRELREEWGLSQEQLAQRAGLTAKYLSTVENGHTNPSLGSLARIAAGLDLPVTALVAGAEIGGDLRTDLAVLASLVAALSPVQRRRALRVLTVMFAD